MSFKSSLVLAVLLLVLASNVSDGRYLPTRSDDSRKEEIREILQELLDTRMDRSAFAKRFLVRGSSEPEPVSALYNYESS